MVKSILDTDLYKFSMSYAYMRNYPDAEGTFTFNDRSEEVFDEKFIEELRMQFVGLSKLNLSETEYKWCVETIPYIPEFYWAWLKTFKFDCNIINVYLDENKHLCIDVTDKMYKATLYEVPILAIVAELRNRTVGYTAIENKYIPLLEKKIELANLNNIRFSEFGTRRRFSYNVQDSICKTISKQAFTCTGTSNVHFAMKYGLTPIGTMAHEFIQFHGGIYGYKQANYLMMETWVNTFDGNLGIALTDTYTSDVFFKNFSKKHAKLFDGVRQDSGDEYEFVNKSIARYRKLGIDPSSKVIVFSNALDFNKALDINSFCEGRIKATFGIGTNLTCDIPNVKPCNIVMKLTKCRMNSNHRWEKCIKVSDDIGKRQGCSIENKIFDLTYNNYNTVFE